MIWICVLPVKPGFMDTTQDETWIKTSTLENGGYNINIANRKERSGGGLALVTKNKYEVKMVDKGENLSFQYTLWRITIHKIELLVIAVYRPPYSAVNQTTLNTFLDEFPDWLSTKITEDKNIVVVGDFNVHVNDGSDIDTSIFNDMMIEMGIKQWVTFPTHHNGNSLDLVMTELGSKLTVNKCEEGPFLSDHCIIDFSIEYSQEEPEQKQVMYRKIKSIDPELMSDDIDLKQLDGEGDINLYAKTLESALKKPLDKHAPEKMKVIKDRTRQPWFDSNLKIQKQKTRRSERRWRKYRQDHQWLAYKADMRDYRATLKQHRQEIFSNIILECGRDNKKLYNAINSITGVKKSNLMPSGNSDLYLANTFADHFINKIQKIRDALSSAEIYDPSKTPRVNIPEFKCFEPMPQEEVLRVINAMPTKSCEIDLVPTRLFKQLAPRIIKNLTELINLSLTKGIFVEDWKLATIRPFLKKKGLDLTVGNYHSVSNLMFLSKLLEKCALTQFSKHCDNNHLIPDYQSTYRQGYSCETALLKLVNDVLWSFEAGNTTNFMAIDLLVAFDTMDHNILLQVLRYKFNICGKALTWFDTYLCPKDCRVNVGKEYSSSRDLTCSVSQGSICGPVLYLAYASTFPEAIPN